MRVMFSALVSGLFLTISAIPATAATVEFAVVSTESSSFAFAGRFTVDDSSRSFEITD